MTKKLRILVVSNKNVVPKFIRELQKIYSEKIEVEIKKPQEVVSRGYEITGVWWDELHSE